MEQVAPGAPFSSRLSLGPDHTGLAASVRFRLLDNDATAGDPIIGPTSTGVIEDPAGSGDYVYPDSVGVAPSVAGHYSRAWDMGVGTRLLYDDDLIVTRTAPTPFAPTGNEYVTLEELKVWLEAEGDDTDGFDADIALAVEAASRAIDGYKSSFYYAVNGTRYFSARLGEQSVAIANLASLTSLALDFDNSGGYATAWTQGAEFWLSPDGATEDGFPFTSIDLRSARRFPRHARAIRVTGEFGWPAVPANVKQAAKLLAARLFKRREVPYAILAIAAAEMVTAARLGRIDPDVAFLLDNIPGETQSGLVAVQLR